ncbi:MAG TPA: HWE histidine kinase domain-containing protein [Hyphomonadaceae bacterium]|nr:HWE histidine kinase domain-containing protein [Hyphomonadaceae bacterium]
MKLREPDGQIHHVPARLLVSAIERLAGAKTAEDVIETLRTTVRALVDADGICVVLRDEGKCHYVEEDAIGPLWKGGKFPMETCISGWAMMHKKAAVIPDVFVDNRIPHAIYRETFVKSLVMTPIGRDEPIAALGAYWARHYDAPEEVVATLETLARAAATALENVHLAGVLKSSLRLTELARDELHHRLKNALSAVDAIGVSVLPQEQAREMSERVEAIARAYALLERKPQSAPTVSIGEILTAELAPYRKQAVAKIDLTGGEVELESMQAVALGLAINQLATSAFRRGALASARGGLWITWREENRNVLVRWEEAVGKTMEGAVIESFGAALMKNMVEDQLKGSLRRTVMDGRACCLIEFANTRAREFPRNPSA